jgi:hypothetical protein
MLQLALIPTTRTLRRGEMKRAPKFHPALSNVTLPTQRYPLLSIVILREAKDLVAHRVI